MHDMQRKPSAPRCDEEKTHLPVPDTPEAELSLVSQHTLVADRHVPVRNTGG